MSAIASCESEAYCEYGKLFRTYSKKRVASIGFWSFFSWRPFSYALAALLASAPVTGLVMSTLSLPLAQAHSMARKSALAVVDLIVSFPLQSHRLRRRGGPVPFRDQRPEEALLLPRVRGLTAPQPPFQRPGGRLLFRRALRSLGGRGARVGRPDPLRHELLRGEARGVSLSEPRPGARAGRLGGVGVAQLADPRQRGFPRGFRKPRPLQRALQLLRRPLAHGEQLQGLLQSVPGGHSGKITQGRARTAAPPLRSPGSAHARPAAAALWLGVAQGTP